MQRVEEQQALDGVSCSANAAVCLLQLAGTVSGQYCSSVRASLPQIMYQGCAVSPYCTAFSLWTSHAIHQEISNLKLHISHRRHVAFVLSTHTILTQVNMKSCAPFHVPMQ
jgi:hypothetical protein